MASRNTILSKILEDYPNCNQSSNSIKNESKDLNELFNPTSLLSTLNHKSFTANSQFNFSNNSHLPNTSSSFCFNNQSSAITTINNNSISNSSNSMMNNLNLQLNNKSQNPKNIEPAEAIDLNSSKGKFGWSSCHETALPIIFRKEEKLVPVRIVESKVSVAFRKKKTLITFFFFVLVTDNWPIQ